MVGLVVENIPYKIVGKVNYKILSKKYGIIEHVVHNNMVMRNIKNVITGLLGHGTDQITLFGVGTNTLIPVDTNTALTNQVITTLIGYDITQNNSVTFSYYLDYDEANDLTIGEMGLFTTSGVLVARVNRVPFTKTSDMALEGQWTLEYP